MTKEERWQALLAAAKRVLAVRTDKEEGEALLDLAVAIDQIERRHPDQVPHPLGEVLRFRERA